MRDGVVVYSPVHENACRLVENNHLIHVKKPSFPNTYSFCCTYLKEGDRFYVMKGEEG